MDVGQLNWTRYAPGQKQGHYESFFQRANHPSRPLAFWIRYTIFSPKGRPDDAIGELWAMFFDGETGTHVAVKEEHPLTSCRFDRSGFGAAVGSAVLAPGKLSGHCEHRSHAVAWDLAYSAGDEPIYFLPRSLYDKRFPKAKSFVGVPLAVYNGTVTVDGRRVAVEDWTGSQNHNWGRQHTDYYAFGQVAGFDNAPDSFLEIVSAQLKVGPVWTPTLTPMVLRHGGREYSLVTIPDCVRAKAQFSYFDWTFAAESDDVAISGHISAPADAFVGLTYYNPPGGTKQCLNSKLASCEVSITNKQSGAREVLSARHRAAFEILTDDRTHGVRMQV